MNKERLLPLKTHAEELTTLCSGKAYIDPYTVDEVWSSFAEFFSELETILEEIIDETPH